jgi:CRP-like cAMP-binding protein
MYCPVSCNQCSILATCPMRTLTTSEKEWLMGRKHSWRLTKGRLIYSEHVTSDGVYLLSSGSVKLITHANYSTRIAAVIKPGEWFGLDAILPRAKRLFAAIAREKSTVCFIERARLTAFLRSKSEFSWCLTEKLSSALQDAQQSAVLFSGGRVSNRLCNAIERCSISSLGSKSIEISQLLGVSAETISRELHKVSVRRKLSA